MIFGVPGASKSKPSWPCWNIFGHLGSKLGSWVQLGSKMGKHRAKMSQHRAKIGQHSAKIGQHGAKIGQYRPKTGQHGAKIGQHGAQGADARDPTPLQMIISEDCTSKVLCFAPGTPRAGARRSHKASWQKPRSDLRRQRRVPAAAAEA